MEPTAFALAIACALLCVVLIIVTWHERRRRFYELASKFEGPPALPIIGNARLHDLDNEEILKSIAELTKSYPSPFRFWLGHRLLIAATDTEQLKAILTSPKTIGKSYVYEFLKPIVGELGLITALPSVWRVHRKLIQPTFNTKLIYSFSDVFSAQSKILVDKLKRNLDGPEFKVFDLVALATIDMLCETVMGLKIVAQTNGASDYVNALQSCATHMSTRMFNILLYPDFIFKHSQIGKEFWRNVKIIRAFTNTVIESRRKELLKRRSGQLDIANTRNDEYERMPRKETFLDSLVKITYEGEQWSDKELRDEVTTMMIAGYESTAITNSHVMLMLASHPDVQEKVYQELYEIYGDADVDERPVVHEDLGRMEYLERVIKETMRLYPLLPVISRNVTDDLEIGEFIIPGGSEVFIPILEIHRSEEYWQDAFKFNPDRFLPEEIAKRHPYTYLAFSAGPRNCLGIKFAMMAMKTLQATILRAYVLKKNNIIPVKDIRVKMETVLKTVEPVTLRIEKRIRN